MPDGLTISNTSPLLYLHLAGQLNLLRDLYGTVCVPPAVEAELAVGAARGVDVPAVRNLPWVTVVPVLSAPALSLALDLGPGEAEVIALGLERPGSRLILDDTLARRIARLHNLSVTGTVGVLVKAKQSGLLNAVLPVLSILRSAGLWLSDSLIAEVLRQSGEG